MHHVRVLEACLEKITKDMDPSMRNNLATVLNATRLDLLSVTQGCIDANIQYNNLLMESNFATRVSYDLAARAASLADENGKIKAKLQQVCRERDDLAKKQQLDGAKGSNDAAATEQETQEAVEDASKDDKTKMEQSETD